jgi:hypothetical protein
VSDQISATAAYFITPSPCFLWDIIALFFYWMKLKGKIKGDYRMSLLTSLSWEMKPGDMEEIKNIAWKVKGHIYPSS